MNKKCLSDYDLNESYELHETYELNKLNVYELSEQDFYPPADDRVWKSNVSDIAGGDNFADYCEYIFKILDEEEYFEDN